MEPETFHRDMRMSPICTCSLPYSSSISPKRLGPRGHNGLFQLLSQLACCVHTFAAFIGTPYPKLQNPKGLPVSPYFVIESKWFRQREKAAAPNQNEVTSRTKISGPLTTSAARGLRSAWPQGHALANA